MSARLAAALVAIYALAAAPAFAGTASLVPQTDPSGSYRFEYRAGPGESNRLTVSHPTGGLRLEDRNAPLEPGANCRSDGPNAVVCSVESGFIEGATFDLGDGDDHLSAGRLGGAQVNAGPGDDRVSSEFVRIEVDGGPGADYLDGYVNSALSYAGRTAGVTVIQDGLPNDGEPGEGDNVVGQFTRITGGAGDDELHLPPNMSGNLLTNQRLLGGDGDDRLFGSESGDIVEGGAGDDELHGLGGEVNWLTGGPGADAIRGGAAHGDLVRGGDGPDTYFADGTAPVTITLDDRAGDGAAGEDDDIGADVESIVGTRFDDRLIGSDGDNAISGAGGWDAIEGRGGADALAGTGLIAGGPGPDAIAAGLRLGEFPGVDAAAGFASVEARDGEPDTIACAAGTQTLALDRGLDTTRDCAAAIVGSPKRFRVSRERTVRLRLRCETDAAAPCAGRIYARRSGSSPPLARGRFSLPANGKSAVVELRVSRSVVAQLRRRGRLGVLLEIVTYRAPLNKRVTYVRDRTLLAPRS